MYSYTPPKPKKTETGKNNILKNLKDRILSKKIENAETDKSVSNKKGLFILVTVVAAIILIFLSADAITGYVTRVEVVEKELNETQIKLIHEIDRSAECYNLLETCRNDFGDCKTKLTNCQGLEEKYLASINMLSDKLDSTEKSIESCESQKTDIDTKLSGCINYTERLEADKNEIIKNYRNFVCCISKLGSPDVETLYWKNVNNRIICKSQQDETFEQINISELSC